MVNALTTQQEQMQHKRNSQATSISQQEIKSSMAHQSSHLNTHNRNTQMQTQHKKPKLQHKLKHLTERKVHALIQHYWTLGESPGGVPSVEVGWGKEEKEV